MKQVIRVFPGCYIVSFLILKEREREREVGVRGTKAVNCEDCGQRILEKEQEISRFSTAEHFIIQIYQY